jgi:WD40 repeat protein
MRNFLFLMAFILLSCQPKSSTVKLPYPPKTFPVGDGRIVNSVNFSSDGKFLIAGGENKKIKLIDRETGEVTWTSPDQPDAVLAVAISPDGKYFVATCGDNEKNSAQVVVYNMDTKSERWSKKGLTNDVQLAKFSADGRTLIVANHFNITLFETASGIPIKLFSGHTPDIVAPYGHVDAVKLIYFTKDSSQFISVGWDKNVKIWDIPIGHEIKTFPEAERINAFVVTPDEKKIITGSLDAIHVWNRTTDRVDTIMAYRGEITSMCAVANGRYFVTGDASGNLCLWDAGSYKQINTIKKAHSRGVWSLNPAPDDSHFVSSGGDGKITVWDVRYVESVSADSVKTIH